MAGLCVSHSGWEGGDWAALPRLFIRRSDELSAM